MSGASKTNTQPFIKLIVLLLVLATLFVLRLQAFGTQDDSLALVGATTELRGTIAGDPDVRTTSTRVIVGSALVVLPSHTSVKYGDHVVVRGAVEEPQSFETETGHTFDYAAYLHARGVSTVMQRAELVERTEAGFSLLGVLFDVKHMFERGIERMLSAPQSSLLEGMLLGERGSFPPELLQAFVIVGLIHIVVLSGSNISIVAEAVFRALGFLPRTATYVVGGVVIVLFAIMTGGGAATVRAVIMAAIALLARYLRRPNAALRALVVAGMAMILWNPLVVIDNGFILSMLATFGLITLAPTIESKLTWIPAWEKFNIRSIVATTLAVEVTILPALLYFSGVLSFVSLPINVVVLPLVPVIMFLGFISGMLAMVHPILALAPAFLTDILLRALIWIAESASSLPIAYAVVPQFSVYWLALIYVPLISAASYAYRSFATK